MLGILPELQRVATLYNVLLYKKIAKLAYTIIT